MNARKTTGKFLFMGLALLLCLPSNADGRSNRHKSDGPAGMLLFRGASGWSRPALSQSTDNTILTLRFHRAPKDAVKRIERQLTEHRRTVFTQAEVLRKDRGAVIHLGLARPIQKVRKRKYHSVNWVISVQLQQEKPIPATSYATLLPDGLERLAYEESERDLENPDPTCGVFDVLRNTENPWRHFAGLSLMDCYQARNNPKRAREIAIEIRGNSNVPAVVHVLATLRLSEWSHQRPLPLRTSLSKADFQLLPTGIAQEAALRLTRHAIRKKKHKQATDFFLLATRRGKMDPRLENAAHELRLRLLFHSTKKGNEEQTLVLVDSLPLPLPDHVTYPGVARISAIALAKAERADEAADAATGILQSDGQLVDKLLGQALLDSFVMAGFFEEIYWVAQLVDVPDSLLDTCKMIEEIAHSNDLASPTSKTLDTAKLSQSLQTRWQTLGKSLSGVRGEKRGAALLGARRCDAIAQNTPVDQMFASLCFLASGQIFSASAIWSTQSSNEEADTLTWAVRKHAVASAIFFESMNVLHSANTGRTN